MIYMGYSQGQIQRPLLFCYDGSVFEIIRQTPLMIRNESYVGLWLGPYPWTMAKIGLKDEDLDFSFDASGVIYKEYRSEYIQILSNNPEKPVWFMLADWEGNPMSVDNPIVFSISKLVEENKLLKEQVSFLRIQLATMKRTTVETLRRDRSTREQMKELLGFKDNTIKIPTNQGMGIKPPDIKLEDSGQNG